MKSQPLMWPWMSVVETMTTWAVSCARSGAARNDRAASHCKDWSRVILPIYGPPPSPPLPLPLAISALAHICSRAYAPPLTDRDPPHGLRAHPAPDPQLPGG